MTLPSTATTHLPLILQEVMSETDCLTVQMRLIVALKLFIHGTYYLLTP